MMHRERTSRRIAAASLATLALFAAACDSTTDPGAATNKAVAISHSVAGNRDHNELPPRIRHVFVIVLENENFTTTFGAGSPATFLNDTLVRGGAFLTQYFGTGHFSLDNYISMISGQAPDSATQQDCGVYSDFIQTGTAPFGQAVGNGCIYPEGVRTIANQLTEAGLTWRSYNEDMGNVPSREPATCGHVPIGAVDNTNDALPNDSYADRHNPFVYFHSIIDHPICRENVVPLTRLTRDLRAPAQTPNLVFITPNTCHDGHDSPCASGEPGGLISADQFLRTWAPRILASPAFRKDGLLLIVTDESGFTGPDANTACCNEQSGPNVLLAGQFGPGGGLVGAVAVSRFIAPGTVSNTPYNHYSMLRSIEDYFGLTHLGFAAQPGLATFGADIFTRPTGNPRGKQAL